MVSPRRRAAILTECAVFCLLLFACAAGASGQSRASRQPKSRRSADGEKSTEREDVARFRGRVEAALSSPGADQGSWGIVVADAATGAVIFALHPEGYFLPASDAKLFTTALALGTLGPAFRVQTTIEAAGPPGEDGIVHGDLTLVGRGDANLSNRKFPYEKRAERDGASEKALSEMADAVVAHGVKQVQGDIVADDSYLTNERYPSGWTIDDMLWSYGAAVSAIAVNDNTLALDVRPGERKGDAATAATQPSLGFYAIENSVRTGEPGSEEKLSATREPGSRTIRIGGTIPAGAPPRRLAIAVEEPAEYTAALLKQLLEARGVQVTGAARARHAADAVVSPAEQQVQTVLAEHVSVPLADDIRLMNKASENLHAELLLLLAAREQAGAANREQAVKFAANFFRTAGIADGDVLLNDGSGLSRHDLVTPRAVVQMLRYAESQPWGELYRSTLPVAGEDGTLSERMKNTPAAGHIFAKTGTIEHVNSLSGYATTTRGAHLIFSILGNNNILKAPAADRVLDAIAVAMVEELGAPAAAKRAK